VLVLVVEVLVDVVLVDVLLVDVLVDVILVLVDDRVDVLVDVVVIVVLVEVEVVDVEVVDVEVDVSESSDSCIACNRHEAGNWAFTFFRNLIRTLVYVADVKLITLHTS